MSSFKRTSERPTLPSIHTLDLPFMPKAPVDLCATSTHSGYTPRTRYTHAMRNASTSSSNTTVSRSPSPSLSHCPSPPSSRETSPSPSSTSSSPSPSGSGSPLGQVRMVPCSFEEANAIIVVPPPPHYTAPSASRSVPAPTKPILLVGPAMQQYVRHPQRAVSKGARVHPYRIVASSTQSRMASVASMVSLPVQ